MIDKNLSCNKMFRRDGRAIAGRLSCIIIILLCELGLLEESPDSKQKMILDNVQRGQGLVSLLTRSRQGKCNREYTALF